MRRCPTMGADPSPAVTDAERTITAHHEAGHALGYLTFRIEFRFVAVYRNPAPGEDLGALQPLAHRAPPLRRAVICLAGPAAEARFTGEPLSRLFKETCRTDLRMAQDALSRDPEADLRTALRSACSLVEVQWARIGTLARALLVAERLTYDGVVCLLQHKQVAGWSPPRWPDRRSAAALHQSSESGRRLTPPAARPANYWWPHYGHQHCPR